MNNTDKKRFVRSKFASVTTRYDLLNSLLSLGIDKSWRTRTARSLQAMPPGPVLDLCAGTLPLSLVINKKTGRQVWALDFCMDMLTYGKGRIKNTKYEKAIRLIQGDAEAIPARSGSFSGVTIAFGLRNLADRKKGLMEMFRVLKPGGILAVLEFSRPTMKVFSTLYFIYLENILPTIGGMVSGDKEAYQYLARSIKEFPPPREIARQMTDTGFSHVRFAPLTMGIVHLYVGIRPS